MQQEETFSRVQCGMFRDELNATFRARLQNTLEEYIGRLLNEAKAVVQKSRLPPSKLSMIFQAGLANINTVTDLDKEQTRNEVLRKDPGFANFYEHAFYSYCAETVPELKEPSSVLRAMPPSLPTALHELFKAAFNNPAVVSCEFSHKMGYLEKAFFVESVIRVAFYELLFTHKALRNISMVRSFNGSSTKPAVFGIADNASYRSFDIGEALANVATAPAVAAATSTAALLSSQIRESESGSVASDWATPSLQELSPASNGDSPASTPAASLAEASLAEAGSTLVSVAASEPADAASAAAASEPADAASAAAAESVSPSEATIDIMSNFTHNKPYGDLPEPAGPNHPDPPTEGRCCKNIKCVDGELCGKTPPCHCGNPECDRGNICLNLPPSVHSFSEELTAKIGAGMSETVITPGDSVSQVAA
jgi:hypothetical protein